MGGGCGMRLSLDLGRVIKEHAPLLAITGTLLREVNATLKVLARIVQINRFKTTLSGCQPEARVRHLVFSIKIKCSIVLVMTNSLLLKGAIEI